MTKTSKKYIIYGIILLVIIGLSVGFSVFQKQLLIDDMNMHVRLQEDVRVSNVSVSNTSDDVISNSEEFNKTKLLGNVTFPVSNSYILYKLDLTNYGNVKSGLLNITNNTSGTSYQICDSAGSNCTSDVKTPVCNGSNCTLGSTKEIYLKITSNTSGTKDIDLDLDFEPYNDITYEFFQENTSTFKNEMMSHDTYQITFTSKPETVEINGTLTYTYNKNSGVLNITDIESDIEIQAKYLATTLSETSYSGSNPNNYIRYSY